MQSLRMHLFLEKLFERVPVGEIVGHIADHLEALAATERDAAKAKRSAQAAKLLRKAWSRYLS